MPAGFACGGICDAILIIVSISAFGGWEGVRINALNLPLWLEANGRIVLQYVYKCFRSLDRQLWDIIYCTRAEYYMEPLWSLSESFLWEFEVMLAD